jgi:hypothetical protein
MMQLEVRDFVTRGCATNIDLYHVQAAVAPGAICNPSHVWGGDINANAKSKTTGKRLIIDISFISKN